MEGTGRRGGGSRKERWREQEGEGEGAGRRGGGNRKERGREQEGEVEGAGRRGGGSRKKRGREQEGEGEGTGRRGEGNRKERGGSRKERGGNRKERGGNRKERGGTGRRGGGRGEKGKEHGLLEVRPCYQCGSRFGTPVVGGLFDQLTVELISNDVTVVSCLEHKEDLLLLCLAFGHVVTHETHYICRGSEGGAED